MLRDELADEKRREHDDQDDQGGFGDHFDTETQRVRPGRTSTQLTGP